MAAFAYGYGSLLIVGGTIGYLVSKSLPSLFAGCICGGAILLLERFPPPVYQVAAHFGQALVSGAVAAHMFSTGMRSLATRPLVLSALSACFCLYSLTRATAPPKRSL